LPRATFETLCNAPFNLERVVDFEALDRIEPVGDAARDVEAGLTYGGLR
jgi:hypothetical protein